MDFKEQHYRKLIEDVRNDYKSRNPICNSKGVYMTWADDCHEINLWTYWQGRGNYNARIMLVGQDWGCPESYSNIMKNIKDINSGLRTDYVFNYSNPTDINLRELFLALGYDLTQKCENLFFTNFVLGYRSKGLSGNLLNAWLSADAPYFQRLANIIEPEIIICLGKDTFKNVCRSCMVNVPNIKNYNTYIESCENPVKMQLQSGKTSFIFAEAHCGTIGTMNRNRERKIGKGTSSQDLNKQKRDWQRIKEYINVY